MIEGEEHQRNCPDRQAPSAFDRVPSSLRKMVVWTEEDLKDFKKKLRLFKRNPKAYAEFLEDGVIMHTLILNKLAMDPPPGRIGAQVMTSAIKEFRTIADDVHEELVRADADKRAKELGTKKE